MKHIILQFAETPEHESIDMTIVEYNHDLNLNVFKGTKTPAVTYANQATNTFTKTTGEGSDSDRDMKQDVRLLMDTSTQTRVTSEASDSDARHQFASMLDTSTQTFVRAEESDSDKNLRDLEFLSATRTLTESSEALDSDKP